MNTQAFEAGKKAYQSGDWFAAVTYLADAKDPGTVDGPIDHMIGNAYMKLGQYDSAASSYADALGDGAYGKVGALSCNMGRALLAAGRPKDAIAVLLRATQDDSYATPYKAYLALGTAYEGIDDIRNAGIAYRNAAIDETNPSPAAALSSLGSCFMKLNRPIDAVEALRTALDFSAGSADQNGIYRDLGLAYVASNRMPEAIDAFEKATADGTLSLSADAQAAFDAARKAASTQASKRPLSDTDAFLASAGYGSAGIDPLDPMGQSGELMPSPEDTGFFSVIEEDLVALDKQNRKIRRKHRHTGVKVVLTILILLLLLAGGAGYAYYRGYGWPTQQAVVESLFAAKTDGGDGADVFAEGVTPEARASFLTLLPSGATVDVTGADQEMTESTVFATAQLREGGEQNYTIGLVRDGLGWKIVDVSPAYISQSGQTPTVSTTGFVPTGTESEQGAEGEGGAEGGETAEGEAESSEEGSAN